MSTYRNKFEERVARQLGPEYEYEALKLPYVTQHTYTPDFVDPARKLIVESKGQFPAADRKKMLAVKAQHPDWTIKLVFQNPNARLSKASSTTYSAWADKHGFAWERGPSR
ncbi:endodeoxyribonuclease [Sphingomonas sp. G-3-2-10]|uniref:endodeoxyribonuclease n=1 Tax=Sphingomonas sp. G-3-2-10 TaxID=2728838 RepID=UPI00146B6B21|nr:endodeoxyribonuclease [Sphingomonas sp. G-3-2-10]